MKIASKVANSRGNSNCQHTDSCNHRTNEPGTESQNTGRTPCNSNRRTLGFDTHLTVQKSLPITVLCIVQKWETGL